MTDERENTPRWKKRTPANYPELQSDYERLFREYHVNQGIKKSTALEMIGRQYGVSMQTVMRYIFPQYKNYQKNFGAKKWSYQRENPEIKNHITSYKRRYMHLRLHIDQFLEESFQCTPLNGSLSLDDISQNIELQTRISLSPDTILGLNKKYEAKHGRPIIEPVYCENLERYRLNLKG